MTHDSFNIQIKSNFSATSWRVVKSASYIFFKKVISILLYAVEKKSKNTANN